MTHLGKLGPFVLLALGAACATEPPLAPVPQTEQPAITPPSLESYELRQDNDRLRREVAELRAQVEGLDALLEQTYASLTYYYQRYGVVYPDPHPGVDGRVLAVHGRILELSVGAEDGVEPRDMFALRRGADYVGMVTVAEVRERKAYARVEGQNRGKAFPPRAGDVAYDFTR